MKKRYTILICFCWVQVLHGQNYVDSFSRLVKAAKSDTAKVNALWHLAEEYIDNRPDTALQLAEEALLVAKKNKYGQGEGRLLYTIGKVYKQRGDYPRALQLYLESQAINERTNQPLWLAANYLGIGELYDYQNDETMVLSYYEKARKIYQEQGLDYGVANVLLKKAVFFQKENQLDSALRCIQAIDGLHINRHDFDNYLKGKVLNELGNIHAQKGNKTLAKEFYRQSFLQLLATQHDRTFCSASLSMAKLLFEEGKADSALFYARQSLSGAKEKGFTLEVLNAADFLSGFFKNQHRLDSAFVYLEISNTAKDSLFNREKTLAVQKHLFEDIAEQERQKTRIKLSALIAVSFIFFMLAFMLWRNNKTKQKANEQLQQQKQEIQRTLSELKAVQKQLIHAEKMASLGEVTAGIAHEIQNPLNFITNFSDVGTELIAEIKENIEDGRGGEAMERLEELAQGLKRINKHGNKADAIVKNMLQHSRNNIGTSEPTDLNTMVEGCLRLCYETVRSKDRLFNAVLETHFDANIGTINIVPQDMGRVLLNLFNNAFYSVQQKKKQLQNGYEPTLQVATRKGNNHCEVRILDNGIGIPEKVIDKIYQPFFTTKPTGDGTGLGLSMSYDIVTKVHGGELKVETKEGEGAEFIVILPLNQ